MLIPPASLHDSGIRKDARTDLHALGLRLAQHHLQGGRVQWGRMTLHQGHLLINMVILRDHTLHHVTLHRLPGGTVHRTVEPLDTLVDEPTTSEQRGDTLWHYPYSYELSSDATQARLRSEDDLTPKRTPGGTPCKTTPSPTLSRTLRAVLSMISAQCSFRAAKRSSATSTPR